MRRILLLFWIGLATVTSCYGQGEVRIGVLGLFHAKELVLEPAGPQSISVQGRGDGFVLNGEVGRRSIAFRAQGDRILADSTSSPSWRVAARDGSVTRFRLSVPGKIHRVYEGRLEIETHHGELTAILIMDRELAVASIVASEMPRGAPLEAMKAQSIVARSFLSAGRRHAAFEFCDTTHCQFLRSSEHLSQRARDAVWATEGMTLVYQGKPLAAMYSSRCGGQTRSLSDLAMQAGTGYPYYAVTCRWCREHPVRWQTHLDPTATVPQPGNESQRIHHARQWGWSVLPGNDFEVTRDSDKLSIEGHSLGHSLGLCQFGAMGMAESGSDFRTILAYYYPNSKIQSFSKAGRRPEISSLH